MARISRRLSAHTIGEVIALEREALIEEVKGIYASLAAQESQQHFSQTTGHATPEGYYENLLNMVLSEISAGTFDRFQSGRAIMDAVAKDKHKWLSHWDDSREG